MNLPIFCIFLIRLSILFATFFLITGCGTTYKGYSDDSNLAPSQVANIICTRGLTIEWLDGKYLGPQRTTGALILPGKHTLRVAYSKVRWTIESAYADLWWVAESGKTYMVKFERRGLTIRIWIEDVAINKPTGGVIGSEDEPVDKSQPPPSTQKQSSS